ncbi:MAG: acyl-CoA dehydrogenase, partial [Actinobacteria bacterium]|nr:acyl-CoA dehydrogenase [Actinomycetota bacterium]
MEIRYSSEAEAYRLKIREILKNNLPADWKGIGALDEEAREKFAEDWKKVLHVNGLLAVNWPKEFGGGGLSFIERVILNEELTKAGAELDDVKLALGVNQLGPTLMAVGTQEQREYFLPRILSGEHQWCQGYSEPNSGSDLAGLAASAYRDGDEWVINGQKIWTSEAHTANWIYLLVR